MYDGSRTLGTGDSGHGVQAVQQALYDLGFSLPTRGASGNYDAETAAAVTAFQTANPPLTANGRVNAATLTLLDTRFRTLPRPSAAALGAPWTPACVRSTICPFSPHTIDVLRTRITLKSFDSISWADRRWDGSSWVLDTFPGGGYNTGTEIGVLNDNCEHMAQTLYHEVLHAQQPTTHRTTRDRESYAYRIGEEFSIAMGFSGRPSLRSTNAQGREFADPARVGSFVAGRYPSVPTGASGDEIVGFGAAPGHVRLRRPDGSFYERPAAVGERVPGPISLVNERTHPTSGWTCP